MKTRGHTNIALSPPFLMAWSIIQGFLLVVALSAISIHADDVNQQDGDRLFREFMRGISRLEKDHQQIKGQCQLTLTGGRESNKARVRVADFAMDHGRELVKLRAARNATRETIYCMGPGVFF